MLEEIRGHESVSWVGISEARSEEEGATLEAAILDVALQAARTHHGKPIKVVEIEFIAHNPHITQYKVKAVPGG